MPNTDAFHLLSGYQFVALNDLPLKRERIKAWALQAGLKGTVLIAEEGINFSLFGSSDRLAEWRVWLSDRLGCSAPVLNQQRISESPFQRLKVRVRPEIVTFDRRFDAQGQVGQPVDPHDWNQLLERDDVQLVDTRNRYEVELGSFEGALNPGTESFTDFQQWASDRLDPQRPVAMFCTGGVRCEKASDWLMRQGFADVYQLHGGILSYLEQIDPENSRWHGECFVFDDRVAVNHALEPTGRQLADTRRMTTDGTLDDSPTADHAA